MSNSLARLDYLPLLTVPPGTVITTVAFRGLATHAGIVSDALDPKTGEQMVIHNRRSRGTVEEPISRFCGQGGYLIEGFPGKLSEGTVVARARSKIGAPWNLFEWNCEDMVNYAHGLRGAPTQVKTWALAFTIVGVLALILWTMGKRRR